MHQKIEPMSDTVFRDLDALPSCDPNTAELFWANDAYAKAYAQQMCRTCPLGPNGRRGNVCLDFYDSHPEITGGIWGGVWKGDG